MNETVVVRLAAKQQGVVSRAQLVAAGLSEGAIDWRITSRALLVLHRGVYAIPGTPETLKRRLLAAVLAAGHAVASHRAAAHLLGIGNLEPAVQISVPLGQHPAVARAAVFRTRLPKDHMTARDGIPVTTAARTLCDLAGHLEARPLELVLDHALARRLVTVDEIQRVLASLGRTRRGAGTLRALLAARSQDRAHVESPLEQELAAVLAAAGIQGWVPQFVVGLDGRCAFLDVAFPAAGVGLEADGYRFHSSRTDWENDQSRHTALAAHGWRVLRVTRADLREGRAAFLRHLRRAIAGADRATGQTSGRRRPAARSTPGPT